jgi:proteasome beta subunit
MAFQYPYPGATTLGIRGRDAVVLASEKRLTYGYFVMSKNVRKVFQITPKVGAACAGFVSDMQNLIRDVKFLINLYEGWHSSIRTQGPRRWASGEGTLWSSLRRRG